MKWPAVLNNFNPKQICILCVIGMVAGAGMALQHFAAASDVSALKQDVSGIRAELMQKSLFDLKVKHCEALKKGDVARYFAEQIQKQTEKYAEFTGRRPEMPKCEDL